MKAHSDIKRIMFSARQIEERVKQVADEITQDYQGKRPLIAGVLKGAWIFVADLLRQVELDVDVDFICVASYGGGRTYTSGEVTLLKDLTLNCTGRDVILVEDIVDSGITLSRIKEMLLERKANSVRIAALLSKPSRRKVNVEINYLGFEVPDEFVVGYGMDFDEKFRTLSDICVLKKEAYGGE